MQAVPKFEVYDSDDTSDGVFKWGPARDELFEMYYDAYDQVYIGEIEDAKKMLAEIIEKDRHFIDAYTLLGTVEMELGNIEKGRRHQQKAYGIGQKIIPDNFNGRIRWGFTENRPFLRAMHSVGLHHMTDTTYDKSIDIFEKILAYNPDDNQGIRYLIGDLYFLGNQYKKAEAIYRENQNYPPYIYSLGLLHFALGNQVKALTYFQRGILTNLYISDYLRMKVPLIPYEIWHASNFEMIETAYDYINVMMPKWVELPQAIEMLQFLHLTAETHSEIQQTYMLKNELYLVNDDSESEGAFSIRGEILDDIKKIKNRVTEKRSKKIYKKWKRSCQKGSSFLK